MPRPLPFLLSASALALMACVDGATADRWLDWTLAGAEGVAVQLSKGRAPTRPTLARAEASGLVMPASLPAAEEWPELPPPEEETGRGLARGGGLRRDGSGRGSARAGGGHHPRRPRWPGAREPRPRDLDLQTPELQQPAPRLPARRSHRRPRGGAGPDAWLQRRLVPHPSTRLRVRRKPRVARPERPRRAALQPRAGSERLALPLRAIALPDPAALRAPSHRGAATQSGAEPRPSPAQARAPEPRPGLRGVSGAGSHPQPPRGRSPRSRPRRTRPRRRRRVARQRPRPLRLRLARDLRPSRPPLRPHHRDGADPPRPHPRRGRVDHAGRAPVPTSSRSPLRSSAASTPAATSAIRRPAPSPSRAPCPGAPPWL